jgi:signal transduction histidine kinase
MVAAGMIEADQYYSDNVSPDNLYLHFVPFLQGMLYVGNTSKLSQENLDLIQSLAEAFATAYARYEDFSKLEAAKQQIEITLTELKATQSQLIQKEKMASLGELTAGIAHEIQNPLNFVNNFSEVNKELIEELEGELSKAKIKRDEVQEAEVLKDIRQNTEKILHHGRRADAIVKSMLQHSRASAGKKEPTDINALADEYLRLSYQGLRAKDKNFNATIKTDFDESIGKIDIVPQDIGRVLLNLYNNAFYAVSEKKKTADENYKPTVTVATKLCSSLSFGEGRGEVKIIVKDNGPGIPQKIVDKIFQPFFTTKPTGQGTGLGLSLSYDIIKAHRGELKVETKEGEGTEFIIKIPNN